MARRERGQHRADTMSVADIRRQDREDQEWRAKREEMRQVTRELHEAAQEALDSRRQLRETLAEWRQAFEETREDIESRFADSANACMRELRDHFDEQLKISDADLATRMADIQDSIQRYFSKALKATDPEHFWEMLLEGAAVRFREELLDISPQARLDAVRRAIGEHAVTIKLDK